MYDSFFAKGQALRASGEPFAVAIVVRAEAPTSAKPGDKAIVTQGGVMFGWIGGSCAQPTVVAEAQRAIAEDRGRLIRLTPDPERSSAEPGIEVRAMTCYSGGTLDVYIEPQQPQPKLIIVGNLPTAQALAHLAKAMSYYTVAIDPAESGAMGHADQITADFGALEQHASPISAVVVATHGNGDEEALEYALRADIPYVGLVASPKRGNELKRYLQLRGLGADALAKLVSPAGLDIGARRGDEIALSILTEIVQRRRAAERLDWPEGCDSDARSGEKRETGTENAIDPICHMTVAKDGARHTAEHDGTTYYFCCAGCQARFEADPSAAIHAAGAA